MTALSDDRPADQGTRRRILRRASYYTAGFIAMTLIVATAGSALIAWFLTLSGLPFRVTWIALTLLVLAVPPLGMAGGALRRWWRRGRSGGSEPEPERGSTAASGATAVRSG